MFEIENCYRLIFEAMLEDSALQCIAERMEQYTRAGTAFVTGAGVLAGCSGLCARMFPVSAGAGRLVSEDYAVIRDKEETDGRSWCITPVYGIRMAIGYVVLIYGKKEEEALFQELGELLAQNVKRYFEEEQKKYLFCQPLKEHMAGSLLFEEDPRKHSKEPGLPEGSFIVVLFRKKDGQAEEQVAFLRNIWNSIIIYEEEDTVLVLLHQVKEQDAASVYAAVETEKLKCCISEVFTELCLCRDKKDILKRIAWTEELWEGDPVRREKEWSMRGMYTYAMSLIKIAGLKDYSIEQLILEDEKNHTELYHTLKTYLLCENNVTIAAKRLHIHRNTLVYRLKQIRECLDVDTNDHDVSRELLAFMMMNDIAGENVRSDHVL